MKSFNDGPEQGCWALWLQNQLLGSAFYLFYTRQRFPNIEGETEQGIGISPQNNSTYPFTLP